MPLVRLPTLAPDTDAAPPGGDLEALRSGDANRRREAARSLGRDPASVAALAAALDGEAEPAVRQAIFSALARIGTEEAAAAASLYLRSEQASLRGGAVEALRSMADAALPILPDLLSDQDPDVRILVAEVARGLPPAQATELLCRSLEGEAHPNAVAAAVDVLTETGTRGALPTLERLAARFAADPFLPFAISVAKARIAAG